MSPRNHPSSSSSSPSPSFSKLPGAAAAACVDIISFTKSSASQTQQSDDTSKVANPLELSTCATAAGAGAGAATRTRTTLDARDISQKYVKVLVPQLVAGTLIGKGGKGLNWFRRKSGVTDLFVSLPDELFPGTDQRVVVLMGKQKTIMKGLSVIIDLIAEKETQINQLTVRLAVPKSSVCFISAKTNARVASSSLQGGGGAQVFVADENCTGVQEVLCVVSGKPVEVRNSCKTLALEIQADSSLQHYTNVSYNVNAPFSFPCFDGLRFNATSSSFPVDLSEPVTPIRVGVSDPAEIAATNSYIYPPTTTTTTTTTTTAFASESPKSSMWDALPALDFTLLKTPDVAMTSIPTPFVLEETNDEGLLQMSEESTSSYGSYGCPSPPPPEKMLHHRLSSSSSGNSEKKGGGEWKRNNAAGTGYGSNNNNPLSISSSLSNLKLDLSNLALLLQDRKDILNFFTVIETRVPASVAGTIIGSHGRYIREIQDMSGATVNVSRENDPSSSTDSRTLQILGTVEAVYAAYALCIGRVLKGSERISTV